jgi:hypothetical protein
MTNSFFYSGADDFLPLVTYIMIQANIPFIYSELEFIADFIPETHLLGKNGTNTLLTRVTKLTFFHIFSDAFPN